MQSGISGGNLVPDWSIPPGSIMTPDYFNSCYSGSTTSCGYVGVPNNFGGYCPARTGNAYAGVIAYYTQGSYNSQEYIHQQLYTPLIAGQCYEIEFWVRLSNNSAFSVDKFGALISGPNSIQQQTYLQIEEIPTINSINQLNNKQNWTKIYGTYLAQGGEQFITIGNFFHYNNSNVQAEISGGTCALANEAAYYYIDDVIVQPCNGVYGIGETICEGDSITLYAYGSTNYYWAEASYPSLILSISDSLVVNPIINTSYLIYGDTDTTAVTVYVNPLPTIDLPQDTMLCQGTYITLEPTIHNGDNFWWQDGSLDSAIFVEEGGLYTVIANNACGTSSESVLISFDSLDFFEILDTIGCIADTLIINAYSPGATYFWSTGALDSAIAIDSSGTFWLEIGNDCGTYLHYFNVEFDSCSTATDTVNTILIMPNVFSPNDDGLNDFFLPIVIENVEIKQVVIFNRWGNIVFNSEDEDFRWNGKCPYEDCSDGTYYWNISYKTPNGKEYEQHGFVELVK